MTSGGRLFQRGGYQRMAPKVEKWLSRSEPHLSTPVAFEALWFEKEAAYLIPKTCTVGEDDWPVSFPKLVQRCPLSLGGLVNLTNYPAVRDLGDVLY